MGRYMRKPKSSGEALGVLTRSKTLALQKQQSPNSSCNGSPSSSNPTYYLELRSRKLEKQPHLPATPKRGSDENSYSVGSATFGENFFENGRNTRESTPCSTPCSSTRPKMSFRLQRSSQANFPSPFELEEFFASTEQIQQQIFMDKYNFDPVSEMPLSGRYQWVKVDY